MEFKISARAKKITFGLMIVGAIATVIGFITEKSYIHTELSEDGKSLTVSYPGHITTQEELTRLQGEWSDFKTQLKEKAKGRHIVWNDGHAHGEHGHDAHLQHEGGEEVHNEEHHDAHGDHHEGHHGHHFELTPFTIMPHVDHTPAGHAAWHGVEDTDVAATCAVQKMIQKQKVGMADHHHGRFWSNLLVNGFFFFGIALGALFYLALHYATESGWGAILLRIFEAVMLVLPFGAAVLIIVFATGTFDLHHIYHWMDASLVDPASEHFDKIIYGKSGYLNKPFFWIRAVVFIGTFIIFARMFRKWSLKEDQAAEGDTTLHFKQYRRGALFLVFFAVFSSMLAWDWIMSIDAHWFSTLFGWYTFSGVWISGMIMILMTMLYLKSRGYMPQINQSHIHDVGKWIFAISFLWSYLWFSQFILIWYSDISEEVTYFVQRINDYKFLFFGTFAVNFILPMILLMSRDAKRSWPYLITIGGIIFIGHWLDVFMMVMPGTVMNNAQIGFLEVGMFLLFLGIFLLLMLRNLTGAPLIKKNHPMLGESIHHDF